MESRPHMVFLDAGSIGMDIPWPDFAGLGRVTMYDFTSEEETASHMRDAELVLTNKVVIKKEHMVEAPGLKYIGTLSTGINQVDGAAAAERGVPLCNVPGYSGTSVVQHVFALLLQLQGGICAMAASVKRGEWSSSKHFSYWPENFHELSGKTMGVVGFGDIGSGVALLAHHLGMRVVVYAPRPKPAPGYEPFAFVSLEELFSQSDVISLHCPLTPETRDMVDARLLGRMKKNAFLINTARGQLIKEEDLARALKGGQLAGAGLDVVRREPMDPANPLLAAPNCLITPHMAWATVEARIRLMQVVYDNVANFLSGRPSNVQNGL